MDILPLQSMLQRFYFDDGILNVEKSTLVLYNYCGLIGTIAGCGHSAQQLICFSDVKNQGLIADMRRFSERKRHMYCGAM